MESGEEIDITKMPSQLKNLLENIDDIVAEASKRAQSAKLIEKTNGNDFDVDGTAYADLEADRLLTLSLIAEKRMECLGYLCGNNDWEVADGSVQFLNPINVLWAPVN